MKEMILTFISILVAEIGDKTQLAIMSFASKTSKPFYIWLAASLAFLVMNFISVFLGQNIAKFLPHHYIKYISGAVFIIIGILTIFSK
ncbi:MAG: TMEM165/GDT1 family protein [Endomicrobiia bacterium]